MKRIAAIFMMMALAACSAEPGSKKWCAAKEEQPKSEWSGSDATTYLANCVIDGMEVGSKRWCEHLEDKPKGDWSSNEATTYAKHCVI